MKKTIKVLKKHKIVIEGENITLVPLIPDYQKKVKKWIIRFDLLPLLFPDDGRVKSLREKLAHGLFKGILVNTMIVHWSHSGYNFLIKKGDKVIGFTALWLLDKDKRAYRIPIVIPEIGMRRQGVGSEVLNLLENFIKTTDDRFVILVPHLPQNNECYTKFYPKNEFTQADGENPDTITFYKRYETTI